MNEPPADQAERDRAIASRKNLAVTAGAGTGKTSLLVSKICRKVIEEGVDIRQILALTFTEKAANELRKRVQEELEKAGKAEGLDRAEIGTIHSFCTHVLRQFPVEAGVAPDFKVDEGAAANRLFEKAWPRWLERELGPRARRPRIWQEVLRRTDLKTLRELAEGLCSFSIPDDRGDGAAMLQRMKEMAAREIPEPWDPPPKKPKGAGPGFSSAFKLIEELGEINVKLVAQAVDLVSDFAGEFKIEFLRQGYVTFDALLGKVRDLFRNSYFQNILELLREKYRYILVDEFQDTDPMQGEIIARLAEGPDGKLAPGKLFLVGDPKQSIYSFRGADIVAYQKLVDRILEEGGERVVLSTNFRSHAEILGFVNDVFSVVIKERPPLQPPYERIEPYAGRAPLLPGPSIEATVIEGAKADESREAEAWVIADWIKAHAEIPYKQIAILLKALTSVTPYIEALRAQEIPYIVQGEKYFYGTSEVIDFVNLLRAVANPHDRIAVVGVLRSPYGALSDQELHDHRKALDYRGDSDIPLFRFLKRWHDLAGTIGVGDLIDAIFEESYALEIAQAGGHGDQAVANLLKLRRKAATLEAQGGCTLREFLDVARRAIGDMEEEGESPLADETLNAVTLLSIHKSKGLEYPVVILPDLHHGSGGSRGEPVVRYDWPTRTLGVRLGDLCDDGGAALAYLDRERKREEEKRLLYVAVTRAEEKLLLLGSAGAKEGAYLSILLPELEKRGWVKRMTYRPSVPVPLPPPPEPERPDWQGFVARWRDREKRAAAVVDRFTSPSRIEGEKVASRAIDVGVQCHAVLEHLDFKAPVIPDGIAPEAVQILRTFFASAPFKELAEAEILARELPFLLPRGDRIVQGVIDVVYRSGGKTTIGDYKTDKIMEPGDYGVIREIYTEAVRRILKVEPGFKLFYLRHGKEVEP